MTARPPAPRRWLAPEVVQTSAMDCGPAALTCLLQGHGLAASYGRLREACQTSVDGSSIDTLEEVAAPLGLHAEQMMLPAEHLLLPAAAALPALVVAQLPDGTPHFVVAWRRLGPWVQVMDPATGRHWQRAGDFLRRLLRHQARVPEAQWREFAGSDEGLAPLQAQIRQLGGAAAPSAALMQQALADPGWFGLGALQACVSLVHALLRARGLARGAAALALAGALFEQVRAAPDDIFALVPAPYWPVVPDPQSTAEGTLHLLLHGVVLLRVSGRRAAEPAASPQRGSAPWAHGQDPAAAPGLAPELSAALHDPPPKPLRTAWRLVCQGGLTAPLALAGAVLLAAGALVVEALLFQGLWGAVAQLGTATQRALGLLSLLGFLAVLASLEWPVVAESLRLGRQLELRLRTALLDKLPRLADRYFQSRSVSDMAERVHSLQHARQLPGLALNLLQTLAELLLTWAAVAWIAPGSAAWAAGLVALAVLLPLAFQPLLGEQDLRLRAQASALHGFYLDALLGLVPVRAHGAERAVQRQHEGLLVAWLRSRQALNQAQLNVQGLQSLLCTGLAGGLLAQHFLQAGGVSGGDLLLVYWVLKLPVIGQGLAGLAQQVPAQRNVLLRLLEPLEAPEEAAVPGAPAPVLPAATAGVAVQVRCGSVVVAGHTVLQDLELQLAPGEHVAIVGASGAGKSTLLGLLLGWHRLAQGGLSVDGDPLDPAALERLRRSTAWVDPGVQLWNASFLDNLTYACAGTAESGHDPLARVGAVLAAADLRGVLQKLPQGLQTPLGEGGALLSGGEGQRLRLGRAMMQENVRLALLDEPFRGLDRAQRTELMDRARGWWHAATLVCVTHDLQDTLAFDRVLVVEDGRIVQDGAPAALAGTPGRYAQMLAAERALHARLWQGPGWRRLRLEHGRLHAEPGTPPAALEGPAA